MILRNRRDKNGQPLPLSRAEAFALQSLPALLGEGVQLPSDADLQKILMLAPDEDREVGDEQEENGALDEGSPDEVPVTVEHKHEPPTEEEA